MKPFHFLFAIPSNIGQALERHAEFHGLLYGTHKPGEGVAFPKNEHFHKQESS